MMASAQPLLPSVTRRNLLIPIGILAAMLLSGWLLRPLLTPAHVEGFTASVASLALHLDRDLITNFDPLQPLNTEYFGLSKLGWVLGTAGLIKLGLGSVWAMTLLNWAGFAGLCFASTFLVRKWTNAPLLLIGAGLLLLPGISENAFFFNDNILSSALAAMALAALYLPRLELGAAICGLLFGLAVLTRTDTILLGVAVPIILWERERRFRPTVLALVVSGLFGSTVLLGTLALFHASIMDLLRVNLAAAAAWNRDTPAVRPILMAAYFLGLPAAMLVVCGLVATWRRRSWLVAARLLAVPMLFALVIGSKLWESRQFLPLTPFMLALAIEGFRLIWDRGGLVGTILRSALGALLCVSLIGPPGAGSLDEGPRALTGRLANIEHWRRWQTDVVSAFALFRTIPDQASGVRPVAVIVDLWNEDRFSHLTLEEAGFAVEPSTNDHCAAVAEHFVKGPKEIYLIRPQQSYVPYWRELSGVRLQLFGLPCIAETHADVLFVASRDRIARLLSPMAAGPADDSYAPFRIRRLNQNALLQLVQGYRADAQYSLRFGGPSGTLGEGSATTRRITNFH